MKIKVHDQERPFLIRNGFDPENSAITGVNFDPDSGRIVYVVRTFSGIKGAPRKAFTTEILSTLH